MGMCSFHRGVSTGVFPRNHRGVSTGVLPQGCFHRGCGSVIPAHPKASSRGKATDVSKDELMAKMNRDICSKVRLLREEDVGINLQEYIRQIDIVMTATMKNPDGIVKETLGHLPLDSIMKLSESMSNNNVEYKMKVLKKCIFKDAVEDIGHKSEAMDALDTLFGKVATYIFHAQYLGDGGFNTKGYGKDIQDALMNKSAEAGARTEAARARSEAAPR